MAGSYELQVIISAIDNASATFDKLIANSKSLTDSWLSITAAGVALGGSIEAMNRLQAQTSQTVVELAGNYNTTAEAIRNTATEIAGYTDTASEMVDLMHIAQQQGAESTTQLKAYAEFWDMVSDATGKSSTSLAEAGNAMKRVGIDSDNLGDSTAALGYVYQHAGGDINQFMTFLGRTGKDMETAGISINDAAAAMGVLYSRGTPARNMMVEMRDAMKKVTTEGMTLNEALGVSASEWENYTGNVAACKDDLQNLAAVHDTLITPLQKVQNYIQNTAFKFSEIAQAASNLVIPLMALGPAMKAMEMIGPLTGQFSTLFTVMSGGASVVPGLTGGITGLGASLLALGPYIAAVVIALGLLYLAWTNNWGGIQEKTKAAVDFVGDRVNALSKTTDAAAKAIEKAFDAVAKGATSLDKTATSADKAKTAMDRLGEAAEKSGKLFDFAAAGMAAIYKAEGDLLASGITKAFELLGGAIEKVSGYVDRLAARFTFLKPLVKAVGDAAEFVSRALSIFSDDNLEKGTAALNRFADESDEVTQKQQGLQDSIEGTGTSLDKTGDAAKTAGSEMVSAAKESAGAMDSLDATVAKDSASMQANMKQTAQVAKENPIIQKYQVMTEQGNTPEVPFVNQTDQWLTPERAAQALQNASGWIDVSTLPKEEQQSTLRPGWSNTEYDTWVRTGVVPTVGSYEVGGKYNKPAATTTTTPSTGTGTKAPTTATTSTTTTTSTTGTTGKETTTTAPTNPLPKSYQTTAARTGTAKDSKGNLTPTVMYNGVEVYQSGPDAGKPIPGQYTAPATESGGTVTNYNNAPANPNGGPYMMSVGGSEIGMSREAAIQAILSGSHASLGDDNGLASALEAEINADKKKTDQLKTSTKAITENTDAVKSSSTAIEKQADAFYNATKDAIGDTGILCDTVSEGFGEMEDSVTASGNQMARATYTSQDKAVATTKSAQQLIAELHASGAEASVASAGNLQTGTTSRFGAMASDGLTIVDQFVAGVIDSLAALNGAGAACAGGICGSAGAIAQVGSALGVGNGTAGLVSIPGTSTLGALSAGGAYVVNGRNYGTISTSNPTFQWLASQPARPQLPGMSAAAQALWSSMPCAMGFAEGGEVGEGGVVVVGEKGPELLNLPGGSRITPLSSKSSAIDYDKMADAFTKALSRTKGGKGGGEVHVHVGGVWDKTSLKTLARMLKQVDISENLRTGRSVA